MVYEENGKGAGAFLPLLLLSIPFAPFIALGWRVWHYSYVVLHWHILFCWIAGITTFIISLAICITVIALLPRFIAALAGAIYFGLGAFYLTSGRSKYPFLEDIYTNDPVWIGFWCVLSVGIGALIFAVINITYGKVVNGKSNKAFSTIANEAA